MASPRFPIDREFESAEGVLFTLRILFLNILSVQIWWLFGLFPALLEFVSSDIRLLFLTLSSG